MTCKELVEFLMDYLDGDLPEPQRKSFEEHLSACPDCIAYLATYEETIALGKQAYTADDEPVPAAVPEDLIRAILSARKIQSPKNVI